MSQQEVIKQLDGVKANARQPFSHEDVGSCWELPVMDRLDFSDTQRALLRSYWCSAPLWVDLRSRKTWVSSCRCVPTNPGRTRCKYSQSRRDSAQGASLKYHARYIQFPFHIGACSDVTTVWSFPTVLSRLVYPVFLRHFIRGDHYYEGIGRSLCSLLFNVRDRRSFRKQ